jgi:hypothetical protein
VSSGSACAQYRFLMFNALRIDHLNDHFGEVIAHFDVQISPI